MFRPLQVGALLLVIAVASGCASTGVPRELTAADMRYVDEAGQPVDLDLSRYFPDAAVRMEVSGRAVVRCRVETDRTLQGCEAVTESPVGYRFLDQTLRVIAHMRVRPEVPVTAGQTALIAMNWRLPS